MNITNEIKQQIVDGLKRLQENFSGTESQFSISIGINKSIYSRIKKGDFDKVLSDAKWVALARRSGINLNGNQDWKIVKTPVFEFITTQLEVCQKKSICSVFCDMNDIGKTAAAKYYTETHKNVFYIDCSQTKTKQRLIRELAKQLGVDNTGKYYDVYDDLTFYLRTIDRPIIILDEAGDLQYDAFLEVKAIYNVVEYQCAIYMIGADGLKAKWDRAMYNKKVGYAEIFSRMGRRYRKIMPTDSLEREKLLIQSASMIVKANAQEGTNIKEIINKTLGSDNIPSLRRIFTELAKVN